MDIMDLNNPALGQVKGLTQSRQFWMNGIAALLMVASLFGHTVAIDPASSADYLATFFGQTWAWLGSAGVIATQISTIFRATSNGAKIVGFWPPQADYKTDL